MSDPNSITGLNVALQGRYRIERELGEGGMTTACLADEAACRFPAPFPAAYSMALAFATYLATTSGSW